jgi:hypothetical protein
VRHCFSHRLIEILYHALKYEHLTCRYLLNQKGWIAARYKKQAAVKRNAYASKAKSLKEAERLSEQWQENFGEQQVTLAMVSEVLQSGGSN